MELHLGETFDALHRQPQFLHDTMGRLVGRLDERDDALESQSAKAMVDDTMGGFAREALSPKALVKGIIPSLDDNDS